MPMSPNQMNPAYMLDPSLYGDQQAIDQQRQLAQLLMTQGFTPDSGVTAGGISGRRSPFEAAGRLAQLLSGQSIQGQANMASQALMQRQQSSLQGLFAQQQEQAPAGPSNSQLALALGGGPTNSNAQAMDTLPPQQPQVQNRPSLLPRIPGDNNGMLSSIAIGDPSKYAEMIATANAPTDATKQALQGGFDPQYANKMAFLKATTDPKILAMRQAGMSLDQIYKAQYGEAAKAAEIDRRGGNQFANHFTGESGMVPKLADNANPTGAPGPTGAIPGVMQIPGTPGVLTGNSSATGAGTAQNKMMTIKDADGNEQHMTEAQAIEYAKGGQSASQFNFKGLAGDPADVRRNMIEQGAFGVLGAFDQQQNNLPGFKSGQSTIAAASATKAGALPQEEMSAKWTNLTADNSNAQTVVSRLQNIRELAEKAITGGEQERRDYLNSLFATVGFKPNVEAKTAGDLLDKNAAQIATALRMGSHGGTDALQTLVQAANPNRHMTKEAIAEAVDQLSASQQRIQSKANMLGPVANARDPQSYNAKEIAFDQAADPRIWQIKAMNADQAQLFLSKLPPNVVADLKAKAMKLKELGAL